MSSSFDQRHDFDHQHVFSFKYGRKVPIASAAGQAQYILGHVKSGVSSPNEWLLLCRFANTIHPFSEEYELRQLRQLARHLDHQDYEKKHGFVDPLVAREVEKEIVLRGMMDCAKGYDIMPAMRLLAECERNGPVFSQPERNLLLRVAYSIGDPSWTAEIAEDFTEKRCSRRKLVDICRTLEQTELSWLGMDTLDGLQYKRTFEPGFSMSLQNCEDPRTHYLPFAFFPQLHLPECSHVLLNGTLLFPTQAGWWRSGIRRVDQTFTAPHNYKSDGSQGFEIADEEHRLLFQPPVQEPQDFSMGGMSL